MKIIDILNEMANETLRDGFKFCYRDTVFTYNKKLDRIYRGDNILSKQLGEIYKLEACLNDEILLFQEEVKETEKREENKEIEEYKTEYTERCIDIEVRNKINELVRAYNKLIEENKEEEEK